MYNSLLNFMNQISADGIDFVELNFPINDKIIASYTKEEFAKDGLIYKTNRKYWRMVNGVKNYYCGENESGYVIWKDLDTLKKDIKAEAESNRVISSSITDELIHMKEAEARLKFGCVTTTGASTVVTDNK